MAILMMTTSLLDLIQATFSPQNYSNHLRESLDLLYQVSLGTEHAHVGEPGNWSSVMTIKFHKKVL